MYLHGHFLGMAFDLALEGRARKWKFFKAEDQLKQVVITFRLRRQAVICDME